MPLAAGDVVRFTKNFVAKGGKCRNNDLATVQTVTSDHVTTTDGRVMPALSLLHVDQGIAVTSHASQGKTVDNVIVSAPVAAFAQVSEAQLYVSMSRARRSMHLVTDCKEALREAVSRPSERISPLELSAAHASSVILSVLIDSSSSAAQKARLRARATSSPSPATARTPSDTGTRDEQGFLKPKINVFDPVD